MAEPFREEQVEFARRLTPLQRMRMGLELFERACRIARDGIRHQHPAYSNDEVEEELRRRLVLQRKLEVVDA